MRGRLNSKFARAVAIMAGVMAAVPALAAQPDYLDDRSSVSALVRSFYNAVNRQEYARAYTYFAQGSAPLPYPTFAAGYANTLSVNVVTGRERSDGAAGSIYFTVPVAIEARTPEGGRQQFAGCYTARLVQPGIQNPPVRPMEIVMATLKPGRAGELRKLLPRC